MFTLCSCNKSICIFKTYDKEGKNVSKKENYELKTEELLESIVTEFGVEIADVEYVKEAGNWYLRVYIDKPEGVTINDCENVSRKLSDVLDVEDFIEDSYILEVSSPGLGRALKKDRDFERSLGEEIEIKLFKALEKQKIYVGDLKAYSKETLTVEFEDETEISFDRKNIALVRLTFDF